MTKKMFPMPLVSSDSIESYIQSVNSFKMLTADGERELAERLYYNGDIEGAKALILSHLRFVVHVARGYTGYGLPLADLIQEGNIGLMKAVKRFNPEVGVRLVSFAVHWIKAEIHEYVLRNWRIVKVATTKAQRKLFFNLRKSKKRLGWFTKDEIDLVASTLGVTTADVLEMETRMSAQDAAFDMPVDEGSNSDAKVAAPVLFLEDQESDVAVDVENENWDNFASNRLALAMQELDERSQHILRARWLEDKKVTLQELANFYSVSAERVRQLEKNALNKLKLSIGDLAAI